MNRKANARKLADDLRAVSKIAVFATTNVTEVVEDMHRTIASGPAVLGRPFERPARALTAFIYRPIRGAMKLVGFGIDDVLSRLEPLLGESAPGAPREALLAALNGVVGDHLEETKSALAIPMTFRSGGVALTLEPGALRAAFPRATNKLLVLAHGSSMGDLQWLAHGHDHGQALARDLGYTPVYLHYNSGRHVSTNGRELALLMEDLIRAWPVELTDISILAHSMGGLVSRSACHLAEAGQLSWRSKLRKLVCIGTPHHGSPLERQGNWLHVLLGVSEYSAPIARLARLRSEGVTDLRFGNVRDEDWQGHEEFDLGNDHRTGLALPVGVDCYAIAASTGTRADVGAAALRGDGLVPVKSALGQHDVAGLALAFPEDHQWVALGTGHVDLLHRGEVYAKLREWLELPGEVATPSAR